MAQAYSDRKRESDPYSLPDVEVWYADAGDLTDEDGEPMPAGWYYWYCFPGCLPDSDPYGPFDTETEAYEDMRENAGGIDDEDDPTDQGPAY